MRYGIVILPEGPWSDMAPRWREAEALGFDHAWTYDHLVWGGLPEHPWYGTVSTLTAAATITDRMGLGTFVTSPNFRHPVAWAKDVVALDDISGGRFLCGIGAGGDLDSTKLGIDLTRGQRTRRFAEYVDLLDDLLTRDHVTYDGEFFSADDARLLPRCVQEPRVPFVVAANGPRGMRVAAEHGQGWVTTGPNAGASPDDATGGLDAWWSGVAQYVERLDDVCEQSGRDPAELRRYLSLDASGHTALSSLAHATEQVQRAEDLGFTDVIVHWPRESAPYEAGHETLLQFAEHLVAR